MNNSKLTCFKIISVVGTIVATLYIAEVFLSFFYIIPMPLAKYYAFQAAKSGPIININQYEFKTTHKYNSQGFRDEEIMYSKEADEKRILFIGDSITEGFGVRVNERFSNIVKAKVGDHFKIINVAQLATNPNNGISKN